MAIFEPYSEPLKDEWLDFYGHLNEAYYVVAFTNAGFDLVEQYDLGQNYFERTSCAFYTLESHIRYLKEVRAPAVVEIEHLILGSDEKRIHYGMVMKVEDIERSTFEGIVIHVDTNAGRSTSMPKDFQATLKDAQVEELPSWAGRGISLQRK